MATRKEAPSSAGNEDMFLHGLPTRVKHLETVVDSLHQDSIRTQGAITALAGQVQSIASTIKDLADKLDAARTRKPDFAAMASWAMVIIAFCGLAFYGVSWRMQAHEQLMQTLNDRIGTVETSRFTAEDGDRLEQRVDRLCTN